MVMSRDIISRSSLSKGIFLSNLDGHLFRWVTVTSKLGDFSDFSHPQRSRMLQMQPKTALKLSSRGPAGPSSELEGGGWHRRILEDPIPGNPPRGPDVQGMSP